MIEIVLKALLVFVIAVIADVLWALYIKRISEDSKVWAANYGVAIYMFSFITYSIILKDHFAYAIVYAVGAWIGTYYSKNIENLWR